MAARLKVAMQLDEEGKAAEARAALAGIAFMVRQMVEAPGAAETILEEFLGIDFMEEQELRDLLNEVADMPQTAPAGEIVIPV